MFDETKQRRLAAELTSAVRTYRVKYEEILEEQNRELRNGLEPGQAWQPTTSPQTDAAREADLQAKAEAFGDISEAVSRAEKEIAAAIVEPPSEEQARLLSVFALRKSASEAEARVLFEAVKENHQAAKAFGDIYNGFEDVERRTFYVPDHMACLSECGAAARRALEKQGADFVPLQVVEESLNDLAKGVDMFGAPL